MTDHVLVIGIGNEYRADDAVGILLARRLKSLNLPDVGVIEQAGEGAALIDTWESSGAQLVILIDAVCSGAAPGTIYRLDVNEETIPASFFNYSTHAFSLAEAVELARVLGKLPRHAVIYGIEGSQYAAGAGLSAAVKRAIPKALAKIIWEIEAVPRILNRRAQGVRAD